MSRVKYRNYLFPLPPSLEPLLKGRVGSKWLFANANSISKEDFYDENLTEEDLKEKYTDEVLSKPTRISLAQFKAAVEGSVVMGIKLEDTVDEQLRAMDCEMIDEAGCLRPRKREQHAR